MKPEIATEFNNLEFTPGEPVRGTARWDADPSCREATIRLLWYTMGKGDRDVGVVAEQEFDDPVVGGERNFEFVAPDHPPGFSGRLISLRWTLELTLQPGGVVERMDVFISPFGRELDLTRFVEDEESRPGSAMVGKFKKFMGVGSE